MTVFFAIVAFIVFQLGLCAAFFFLNKQKSRRKLLKDGLLSFF